MSKRVTIVVVLILLAAVVGYAAYTLTQDKTQPPTQERVIVTPMAPNPAPERPVPPRGAKKPAEANPKADEKAKSPTTLTAEKPAKPGKDAGQRPAKRPGPGGNPALAEYRHTFQLMRMFMAISMIERTGQNALKPAQAKQVLSILTPLRSKPKLTQKDAEKAVTRLKKVLTADQLKAIDNMRSGPRVGERPDGPRRAMPPGMPGQRPPQGAPPPGQNGVRREGPPPGGPPGAPGERRAFRQLDPKAMKDFNPFYSKPPKGNEMLEAQARHMDQFFAGLERKAK